MLLLMAFLHGEADQTLFLEFYTRYERKLYAVALNILKSEALAEDAVQDTMLNIVLHFEEFKRIYQKDRTEIAPWCITIAKHAALSIRRREMRSDSFGENWDTTAQIDVEEESSYNRLVELIYDMPEQYREILDLKFVMEWSNKAIAEALGLTVGTVGVRVQRGRALLIKHLEQEGYSCG